MFDACPGSKKFKEPKPDYIKCRLCGEELEIWSDEIKINCPKCNLENKKNQQSCLDWCKSAKECVGNRFYSQYLDQKISKGKGDGK